MEVMTNTRLPNATNQHTRRRKFEIRYRNIPPSCKHNSEYQLGPELDSDFDSVTQYLIRTMDHDDNTLAY